MILLPFLIFLQVPHVDPRVAPHFIPPPNAQEPRMVRAFLQEAYAGLVPGELDASLALNGEPKIEAPDDFHPHARLYHFLFVSIEVDVETGRIVSYSGGPYESAGYDADGRILPRRVTDGDARAIVQRLYSALGFPGEIAMQVKDLEGYNSEDLEVRYLPSVGGVPYANGQGAMLIDRQTGVLHDLDTPPTRADPPASLAPVVSLEAARDTALRAGVDLRGESLDAPDPFRLVVWVPTDKPVAGEPGVATAARKAHRGVLAFSGVLLSGSPRDFVYVAVDARTGKVLMLKDSYSGIPGGNGGRGARLPGGEPVLPSAGPRPWRAAFGAGPLSDPAVAVLTPVAGAAPTTGAKLDLTDGRAAFPARYDPATGLIAIGGKAYRPGPALAALLRRRAKG